jgi:hypothetical protein
MSVPSLIKIHHLVLMLLRELDGHTDKHADMFIHVVNGVIVGTLYDSLIKPTDVCVFCFMHCVSIIAVLTKSEFPGHCISYESCDITNEGKR